ncbi:peptidase [Streptomyces lunaelactis]|uniref:trypsin-like serine peptidase n=1 Tax=Streptomyces lunaelactis TaxID=1535768 RepID=UPI0015859544|nr:peptidase [Streptomyces lunaelactis]NUK03200.1 peptidase [Streptomyces lunaelactis]NUK10044.1 peptidase [Streptomyces lunaelactis]NUK17529.1 peptidase [Streptomyces lunaelactis]NUK27486.1 peptidase [Streptomyces lunaelactis]NUK38560.1 peptidase [Streptomyces lunaelactis]
MRRHRTAAGILLAVGTLLAGALSAATAGAAPLPDTSPTVFKQRQTQGFWTAERMRDATPLDVIRVAPGSVKAPRPGGKETVISPTAASTALSPMAFPQAGGPWTGSGAVVKTSGRVFFSFQGRTASCSGDSVTSQNGSTVITAGHCVKYQGAWHTNWVFVPGYNNGQAPYGQWSATKTFSTTQWVASEDINYDVGAAVVAPLGGRTLTATVGAQGLSFNGGYNKAMYAFGFPAAAPYDGTKLIYCSGNSSKDWLFSQDHSLGCNMTGGSSGGPWFTSFSEATGTGLQASVNSFGYTFLPNRMFGPYFGNDAKSVYDKAQVS